MTVLLDVNILLDVVLSRQPWVAEALAVSPACAQGRMVGHVSAVTLPTIYYVVRRSTDKARAAAAVDLCLQSFEICAVDRPTLELARSFNGTDFEDDIQAACAVVSGLDAIVTRDPSGFRQPQVVALRPADALARLP
jgi:predicted nucleic acid-binding protein